jgi:ketol-acid reductoisomerase
MVTAYYDKDSNADALKGKKIVIFGYGSQGHAHALNLKESGFDVTVALRPGSASMAKVKEAGLAVTDNPAEAAKIADIGMILIPDEIQKGFYNEYLAENLKQGCLLMFGHGFNVHFDLIVPRKDMSCALVAPKGPGHLVRSQYKAGQGVPTLIAIHQDPSGNARDMTLAYACGIGGGKAGIIDTNFKDETETDLFGEQAVLCGGASKLVQTGFEVLTEAGYAPELAYFECLHELKLIVDLMYEDGIANMRYSISNTAEYGDLTRGPRVIDADTKVRMKKILAEIQSGEFAKEWVNECENGFEKFNAMRDEGKNHSIEKVGANLRSMMPWLKGGVKGKDTV